MYEERVLINVNELHRYFVEDGLNTLFKVENYFG